MTDQHSITDSNAHNLDGHDTVRFDLTDDDGSIQRARNQQADIETVPDAYRVTFPDGDYDHLVILRRDTAGWQADCWYLSDDRERIGRCRGWIHHDGPCAHLWAARSHIANQRLKDDDQRHSADIERAVADGGIRTEVRR